MAGNLVKWWRHKILGGYKQFSVLQDSATDSEEIIYPIRAQSSCSAPPDLLMTTTSQDHLTANDALTMNAHYAGSYRQTTSNCNSPSVTSCSGPAADHYQVHRRMRQKLASRAGAKENLRGTVECPTDELVRLEEIHCDVSLDQKQHPTPSQGETGSAPTHGNGDHRAGKEKPQPVQFSFTLYDLDGHGKITKDDIAGIVSTIYESLGKSVVVPHYGSKTINVRLTVSPDSTAAATASKATSHLDKSKKLVTPRRRYRARKLLSDDENSDSSNELTHMNCLSPKSKRGGKSHTKGSPIKSPLKEFSVMAPVATVAPILTTPTVTEAGERNLSNLRSCGYAPPEVIVSPYHEAEDVSMVAKHQQMLMQQKEQRKKLLRKTRPRKQKYTDMSVPIPRARSLSVGNEQRWRRHPNETGTPVLRAGANRGVDIFDQEDPLNGLENISNVGGAVKCNGGGIIGGKSDEECWRSSLRRRELIEIIRESMEKNRLCFQTNNRKPLDSSSPVVMKYNDQRLRSHTINHATRMAGAAMTQIDETGHLTKAAAVNLCGYDSYLHATICAGNGYHGGGGATGGGLVLSPNMGVATPIRKKCNQKLIKSRLRQQQLLAQQQLQLQQQAQMRLQQHQHQHLHQSVVHPMVAVKQPSLATTAVDWKRQQRRIGHRLVRSKSKDELVTRDKLNIVEGMLTTDSFMEKLKITEEFAENYVQTGNAREEQVIGKRVSAKGTDLIVEYGSVPVTAEPGECESLLRCASSATTPNDDAMTVIANKEYMVEENQTATTTDVKFPSPNTTSPVPSSTPTASSVHRYGSHVHTHIHHHYHHFENEENVV